ncbi:Uncharacterized protein FWK35_00012690 [Aphis craccivora]|uniref:Uncharacterized protein n=1 Tax=Aphis craccivora TaxID=307492 RepID=A0A6G0ZBY9_APHCR|nr:Uncharacterized protein FWK35_00012690 [Aphis craccivora]
MTVDPLLMANIIPPPEAPEDDGNISGLPPPTPLVMLPAGDETDGCIRPPVATAAADSGCRKLRLDSVVDDGLPAFWFDGWFCWFCAMHRVRISGNSSSCGTQTRVT